MTISRIAYIDKDDVRALRLNAVREAQAVFQIAAAEEYRVCFSLTNIDSAVAAGVGKQIFLPGAHSDIGGGYRDGGGENKVVWNGEGSEDLRGFLTDNGWATENEAVIVGAYWGDQRDDLRPVLPDENERPNAAGKRGIRTKYAHLWVAADNYLRLNRAHLSNHYSFIPLQLMATFSREQAIAVTGDLEADYKPSAVPSAITARIMAYAEQAKASGSSAAADWRTKDPALMSLRHRFLHFSCESAAGFNLRNSDGRKDGKVVPFRRIHSDSV